MLLVNYSCYVKKTAFLCALENMEIFWYHRKMPPLVHQSYLTILNITRISLTFLDFLLLAWYTALDWPLDFQVDLILLSFHKEFCMYLFIAAVFLSSYPQYILWETQNISYQFYGIIIYFHFILEQESK